MQNITVQDVINYARDKHRVPSAFAENWFNYWTSRNWITTNGKAILNWQVKFDWWVLDHKDKLILTESAPAPQPPTPAELHRRDLQRQRAEREKAERLYQAEKNDPVIQAEIAAIQERLAKMLNVSL